MRRARNFGIAVILAILSGITGVSAQNNLAPEPCEFLHDSMRDYRTNWLESWRENNELFCHFRWHVFQFIALICVEPQFPNAPCIAAFDDRLSVFNVATQEWDLLEHVQYASFQGGCGSGHPPELIGGSFNLDIDLEPEKLYEYRMEYYTGTVDGGRMRMSIAIEVSTSDVDGCLTNP